jgi:hypothetical protein
MNAYVYMGDSTYVELPSQLMGPQKKLKTNGDEKYEQKCRK